MANELEIINNPTSTPAAVSTGYQRQNTRMLAASNGIDNTYVEVIDASTVRLAKSGAVDISGTLYAVGESEDFTVSSAGRYYIYLADGLDASHKTPTLGTDAGTFDAELNARYLATGERVLNWVIIKSQYGAESLQAMRMVGADNPLGFSEQDCIKGMLLKRVQITTAGSETFTAPRSQVYNFELQARGGAYGNRALYLGGGPNYYGGGGGGGGGYVRASVFLEAGTVVTLAKSVSSGGTNSVTGTGITITAVNGSNGGNATTSSIGGGGNGGAGGVTSGYGFTIDGADGCDGVYIDTDSGNRWDIIDSRTGGLGVGGNSFMGNAGPFNHLSQAAVCGYGYGGNGLNTVSTSTFQGIGLFLIWG